MGNTFRNNSQGKQKALPVQKKNQHRVDKKQKPLYNTLENNRPTDDEIQHPYEHDEGFEKFSKRNGKF